MQMSVAVYFSETALQYTGMKQDVLWCGCRTAAASHIMIERKPGWTLAGIYADEGLSGTSVTKRRKFLQMIRDCEAGKIDLILTKSISRFARNTIQCLTYVRHLNEIGVHINFENNNIDTRSAFSEMLLTVLAAFAQEESRSMWAISCCRSSHLRIL